MVINSSIMVRSRPPTRYIIQSGMVGWGEAGGGGGDDDEADSGARGGGGDGGGSVVKAPTALQVL